MYREYLSMITDILDGMDIKSAWHSFKNIPSDHVYATYFVPSMQFDGHDLNAEYYDYTIEVAFFFRGYFRTGVDDLIEQSFEEASRKFSHFTKTCGYDSSNDQFYTLYQFNFKEFF